MAMMVLRSCQKVEGGLPKDVQAKMMFNIVLDFAVGLVPFLGDVADMLFRANTRNAVILEKHLREKGAKAIKQQGQRTPSRDATDPEEFDRQLREELGPPPQYTAGGTSGQDNRQGRPAATQQARVPEQKKGGWFSGFGGKTKQPDVEQGHEMERREPAPVPVPNTSRDGPRRDPSAIQNTRR